MFGFGNSKFKLPCSCGAVQREVRLLALPLALLLLSRCSSAFFLLLSCRCFAALLLLCCCSAAEASCGQYSGRSGVSPGQRLQSIDHKGARSCSSSDYPVSPKSSRGGSPAQRQFRHVRVRPALPPVVENIAAQVRRALERGRCLFGVPVCDVASIFKALDVDGNGAIDRSELADSLRRLDVAISQEKLRRFVQALDTNHNGLVDEAELRYVLDACPRRRSPGPRKRTDTSNASPSPKRTCSAPPPIGPIAAQVKFIIDDGQRRFYGRRIVDVGSLFEALDVDHSRGVDRVELAEGLKRMDVPVSEEDLLALVNALDLNRNGLVEGAELARFLDRCARHYAPLAPTRDPAPSLPSAAGGNISGATTYLFSRATTPEIAPWWAVPGPTARDETEEPFARFPASWSGPYGCYTCAEGDTTARRHDGNMDKH